MANWPVAVASVLAFSCLNSPDNGIDRPLKGPESVTGGALAKGRAGPAPGVAVAVAGGAQLMYRPGVGACVVACTANATTPMVAAAPRSKRKR
jgi:hypothetical protein